MRTAAVTVLAFLMLLPALPAQAQVGLLTCGIVLRGLRTAAG